MPNSIVSKSQEKMKKNNYNSSKNNFSSADSKQLNLISKFRKTFTLSGKLNLKLGGVLNNIEVAFEDYGKLNAEKNNTILICHAISGDSHVAKHSKMDIIGWWDNLVGAGKYIDTNQYYVLCTNILGSCRGTTGPHSVDPTTGESFWKKFPPHYRRRYGGSAKKTFRCFGY